LNTCLDCIPCMLRQALGAARVISDDAVMHRRVLNEVSRLIPELPLDVTPPEVAQQVYRLVYRLTGSEDPYREEKRRANETALSLYSHLKKVVADSDEPLLTACKLAIGGNSIDLGPTSRYADINSIISFALDNGLGIDDYDDFRRSICKSRRIMYLGDNAGEVVFDRILIEEIKRTKEVYVDFVVRESPIINDATVVDANFVGLPNVAEIVSSGSDAPATVLSQCSEKMLELYHASDIIIAKGQGNYETLNDVDKNIFFLLQAKCPVVAHHLNCKVGSFVLTRNKMRICNKLN